jgi:hypothetical protein
VCCGRSNHQKLKRTGQHSIYVTYKEARPSVKEVVGDAVIQSKVLTFNVLPGPVHNFREVKIGNMLTRDINTSIDTVKCVNNTVGRNKILSSLLTLQLVDQYDNDCPQKGLCVVVTIEKATDETSEENTYEIYKDAHFAFANSMAVEQRSKQAILNFKEKAEKVKEAQNRQNNLKTEQDRLEQERRALDVLSGKVRAMVEDYSRRFNLDSRRLRTQRDFDEHAVFLTNPMVLEFLVCMCRYIKTFDGVRFGSLARNCAVFLHQQLFSLRFFPCLLYACAKSASN